MGPVSLERGRGGASPRWYWNEVDHGGHFAAMEQPVIFVNELRKAFRTFRI